MLVCTPTPATTYAYMPSRSSPLAPRHTNACLRTAPSSTAMDAPSKPTSASSSSFAQRAVRPNPLMQRSSSNAARERRRDLFLKKVANDREERRWAGRGEQILRLDYVQRQRRWEAELARSAPSISEPSDNGEEEDYGVDNEDLVFGSSQATATPDFSNMHPSQSQQEWSQASEAEVEAVAQQEDQELAELLALIEEDERRASGAEDDVASQTYGSDEDDYDSIFMNCFGAEQATPQQFVFNNQDYDAMDTSNG